MSKPMPPGLTLASTIAEAKAWLKKRLREGGTCPVCERRVQQYKRKLTGPMVRALVMMYEAGAATAYVHMPTVVGAARADEAKLAYWGLLEEEVAERPDGGRTGYWRVTPRGVSFLRGDVDMEQYALVYNSKCFGFEGDLVSAEQALGEPFRLDELLAG